MSDLEVDAKRDAVRRMLFKKNIPGFETQTGMEIGALCAPLFTKEEANVKYYDICSKEDLMAEFQASYPGRPFVDVDFVAGNRPMAEVLSGQRFDYVIANHVIEHIPDFIGFFKTLHSLLNDGGKLFLAIPDRRFTFDRQRPETSAGHLIVDHEDNTNNQVDSAEHLLDSLIYHTEEVRIYWNELKTQRYHFIHHHHVFNFENFLDLIIRPLIRLRYLPFSVIDFHYEPDLDNEFNIVLEKCTDWEDVHILGESVDIQPLKDAPPINDMEPDIQMKLIAKSRMFDENWYKEKYHDALNGDMTPLKHYFLWGGFHGLNPSEQFDSDFYLQTNQDVANAGYNPLWHYLHNGKKEGRKPLPDK